MAPRATTHLSISCCFLLFLCVSFIWSAVSSQINKLRWTDGFTARCVGVVIFMLVIFAFHRGSHLHPLSYSVVFFKTSRRSQDTPPWSTPGTTPYLSVHLPEAQSELKFSSLSSFCPTLSPHTTQALLLKRI